MGYPNGNGYFSQGLGSDLLGTPGNPAPGGLAGALLHGVSGLTPAPPMMPDSEQTPSVAEPFAVSPRMTDQNVDWLARVLTAECQGTCNADEIRGVGSTVINRMDRDGTDNVADVLHHKAYAVAPTANPDMIGMARGLLSKVITDNTGGATNFYSPQSMPKDGANTHGWDTAGGLEQIPGGSPPHPMNWSPGFANGPKAYPRNTVANARDWVVKFYTQPGTGRVH